jgi:hypothetical protein
VTAGLHHAPAWKPGDRIPRGRDTLVVVEVRTDAEPVTLVVKPAYGKPAQALRGDPDALFTQNRHSPEQRAGRKRCGPPVLPSRPTLLFDGTSMDGAAEAPAWKPGRLKPT